MDSACAKPCGVGSCFSEKIVRFSETLFFPNSCSAKWPKRLPIIHSSHREIDVNRCLVDLWRTDSGNRARCLRGKRGRKPGAVVAPPIAQVFKGHPATRTAIKASGRERTGTVTVNDGAVAGSAAMTSFVYGFVLHGLASTVRAHR